MLPLRDRLPRRTIPFVNYCLFAANILAFIWERMVIGLGYPPTRFVFDWGLVPARFVHQLGEAGLHPDTAVQETLTVFSSMFLHDPSGWLHIGGNMLFLWIFGDNV